MHPWLRQASEVLSQGSGVPASELELTNAEIQALLDAAGFAAHESGARTNAPLLCYLLGKLSATTGDSPVDLVAALRDTRLLVGVGASRDRPRRTVSEPQ
jgi:hypothetical protein